MTTLWKKVLLGVAAFLTALAGGVTLGGYRTNSPEITSYTTSTNSNFSTVLMHNVQDFEKIGFTLAITADTGTVKAACSMQETQPNLAATSTDTNRWDYVDFTDTTTETSIDGYTGVALSGSQVRQFVIRNSVWKWCGIEKTGDVAASGSGTTTVYIKRMDNE